MTATIKLNAIRITTKSLYLSGFTYITSFRREVSRRGDGNVEKFTKTLNGDFDKAGVENFTDGR